MKMKILFLSLFLACDISSCKKTPDFEQRPQKGLTGWWQNELNSEVFFKQAADGTLTGYYFSKVGSTGHRWWPLRGLIGHDRFSTFGFVVNWLNGASSTSWSGQVQNDEDGKEVLLTTWILTSRTKPEDDWKSTLVGKDTFHRIMKKQ